MTDKRKSIRIGKRVIKSPEEVYFKLKENAEKQGLSLVNYLSKLIIENERAGINREISMRMGELGRLLTQYTHESFSESLEYLRVIFLRFDKLNMENRKAFLDSFTNQMKEAMESMGVYVEIKKEA